MPFVLERLFHLEKGQKLSPQQQRAMEVSREGYVPVRLNQVCVRLSCLLTLPTKRDFALLAES